MHRLFLKFLLIGVLMTAQDTMAEIISLDSMKEVSTKIESFLEKYKAGSILAAFDIDFTLTMPQEPAAQMPNLKKYILEFKELCKEFTPAQKDLILNLALLKTAHKLVEPETPIIIENLQALGIKVIAFSAASPGPLLEIPKMEVWRYDLLKSMGMDFRKSFPDMHDIIFTDVSSHLERHPIFYHGILCGNGMHSKDSKGSAFVSFLKKAKFLPKVIVLMDDRREHLEDVEASLIQYNSDILFLGIEYIGGTMKVDQNINKEAFLRFWTELKELVT